MNQLGQDAGVHVMRRGPIGSDKCPPPAAPSSYQLTTAELDLLNI